MPSVRVGFGVTGNDRRQPCWRCTAFPREPTSTVTIGTSPSAPSTHELPRRDQQIGVDPIDGETVGRQQLQGAGCVPGPAAGAPRY